MSDPQWKCGDPLRYPLRKPDKDPWSSLLEPLLKTEADICHVWKDEIDKLLIFAGLFSAVVTAFVVESYKGLQADPNSEIILLLSQIASMIRENINSTASTTNAFNSTFFLSQQDAQQQQQQQQPGMSRINILWFISLVLSITAVLVGIVSSQWIREYQRYPIHITPRDKFALLNMRVEGLKVWHVNSIISILPVILQGSLVLFLVGLIDFINIVAPSEVSIPVIAVIALPLVFIIATTVLPSCYWIPSTLIFMINKNAVPSQCPYRSPQSALFSHLVKALLSVLRRALETIMFCCYRLFGRAGIVVRSDIWSKSLSNLIACIDPSNDEAFLRYRQQCHEAIYRNANPDHKLRDKDFTASNKAAPPLYDCIQGLRKLLKKPDHLEPQHSSVVYYCIQDLFKFDRDTDSGPQLWHQYLQGLILNNPLHISLAKSTQEVIPSVVLQEETLMTALSLLPPTPENTLVLYEHHIRLMNFCMTLPPTISTSRCVLESIMSLLSRDRIENDVDRSAVSRQYTILLDGLFNTRAYHSPQNIFCCQKEIHLLTVAFRAQEDIDRGYILRLIHSQVTNDCWFLTHPIRPQHLLFFLMASYVGLSINTVAAFSDQIEQESLIMRLAEIGDRINFSHLTRSVDHIQSCLGYKYFLEQVELRMARVVHQTRQKRIHQHS